MKNPILAEALAVLLISFVGSANAQAALTMKIDTNNKSFYFEGSDSGFASGDDSPFGGGFGGGEGFGGSPLVYQLQFIHYFTSPAVPANITETPHNLFAEGATLSMSGNMSLYGNGFQNYIFIDLSSGLSDITTLTGIGQSASISYAGLTSSNTTLFESLIGDSLTQSAGTGYAPITVQAIPEPSTYALFGIGAIGLLGRRRKKMA